MIGRHPHQVNRRNGKMAGLWNENLISISLIHKLILFKFQIRGNAVYNHSK